ncbi:MAG TPA: ABC transporter permease subunit [Chloroflexota bacterium]|nr:ABC transporter permease subunit [Chloroflexota bacterium]
MKVLVVLQKEWLELRRDVRVLAGTLLPSLLFTVLPVVMAYFLGRQAGPGPGGAGDREARILPAGDALFAGLSSQEASQVVIGLQFSTFLILLPIVVPSVIASYSIVGEKSNRTLEPLLATPVRTWELLLGKMLAAVVPAVAITWLAAVLFVAGMGAVAISRRVLTAIVTPSWLLLLLLGVPLLALIVVAAMVAISSRVSDPRTAQQISGFLVIPVVLFFIGQITGLVVLRPVLVLALILGLAVVAVLAVWGASRLFQREVILTRWR